MCMIHTLEVGVNAMNLGGQNKVQQTQESVSEKLWRVFQLRQTRALGIW